MKDLRSRLEAELAEKKVLIMAHRGVCGANIIENTMEAFELALRQGADILEMDVFRTTIHPSLAIRSRAGAGSWTEVSISFRPTGRGSFPFTGPAGFQASDGHLHTP